MSMVTGTAARVVGFTSQEWGLGSGDLAVAERHLLSSYVGKIGRVVSVDSGDMPYRVAFSLTARVVLSDMRFYAEEVDAV